MACLGLAVPIQRSQAPKPGTHSRSGTCSRSYQSWNSSSWPLEKSNAAIRMPLGMMVSPLSLLQEGEQLLGDLNRLFLLHPVAGAVDQMDLLHVGAGGD